MSRGLERRVSILEHQAGLVIDRAEAARRVTMMSRIDAATERLRQLQPTHRISASEKEHIAATTAELRAIFGHWRPKTHARA